MIKCCIFDLDGTLLDTLKTITYYVNRTIEDEGFSPITLDECRRFVGNGPKELIERALKSKGYTDETGALGILRKYRENYDSAPYYLTRPYDGVSDMLDALRERGILTAVISNKQNEAVVPSVKHFFGDRFALAYGSREGVPLKPAPDAIYNMLDELGVRADEVVYIGDSEVDIETGKAFGSAKTVGVSWGFRTADELIKKGADVIISSPKELMLNI